MKSSNGKKWPAIIFIIAVLIGVSQLPKYEPIRGMVITSRALKAYNDLKTKAISDFVTEDVVREGFQHFINENLYSASLMSRQKMFDVQFCTKVVAKEDVQVACPPVYYQSTWQAEMYENILGLVPSVKMKLFENIRKHLLNSQNFASFYVHKRTMLTAVYLRLRADEKRDIREKLATAKEVFQLYKEEVSIRAQYARYRLAAEGIEITPNGEQLNRREHEFFALRDMINASLGQEDSEEDENAMTYLFAARRAAEGGYSLLDAYIVAIEDFLSIV